MPPRLLMKASVLVGLFNKIITWLTSVFLSLTNLELMRKVMRKVYSRVIFSSVKFSSVTQLCPTLCNPMDCSTPGFTNSWSLLKLVSIELVMPSKHLILCHPLLLPSILPSIRVFPNKSGQSIGISASASVLPMNIQD